MKGIFNPYVLWPFEKDDVLIEGQLTSKPNFKVFISFEQKKNNENTFVFLP